MPLGSPHSLFADECILFTQAAKRGAARLVEILECYHRASGQLVNKAKSAIFFSKNTKDDEKRAVCQKFEIHKEALEERYLVLPTALGRNTIVAFEKLEGIVKNLVGGWCEKNWAGLVVKF
jgi:hypothetical protein